MKPTAILLLHCPDQPGIITELTKFITDNQGNIVYLDQYVDRLDGVFFMRIEWELDSFLIPREKIKEYIDTLYSRRYQLNFDHGKIPDVFEEVIPAGHKINKILPIFKKIEPEEIKAYREKFGGKSN